MKKCNENTEDFGIQKILGYVKGFGIVIRRMKLKFDSKFKKL